MIVWIHIFPPVNPPYPLRYSVEKRRTTEICVGVRRISVVPPLLSSITQGGSPEEKSESIRSQLRPLATRPAPGCKVCHRLGIFFFLVTLACLDISSKKRCLYRLFIYHFKAHTISNKLVSKVFAQKKRGGKL